PTEAQALLLENTLIKEHQPKFNIRLRDDKSYPQIAVTLGEPFPRVLVVRRVTIPGARYFGPYTDVATLRQTLKIIRRIFTVRSCSWNLPGDAPDRPCLDYHIERCKAPCVGYQSGEDYRRMIDDVLLFLSGKTLEVREVLRELTPGVEFAVPQRGSAAKLVELADQNARHLLDSFKIEAFDIDERAADPVFSLGRDLGLPVVPRAMVCIDISTNQGRDTVGSLVWFEGGRPRKAEYRRYRIKGVQGIDDFAAMKEVVSRSLTRRSAENKQ